MNVFEEGKTDARQSAQAQATAEHSLFRKRYRQLSVDEVALHDRIKDKADELQALFLEVQNTREHTAGADYGEIVACRKLATRHLEDAVYRAVKALTA